MFRFALHQMFVFSSAAIMSHANAAPEFGFATAIWKF